MPDKRKSVTTKPAVDSDDDTDTDSSFEDTAPPTNKKGKQENNNSSATASSDTSSALIDLTGNKFVTVRDFKGRLYVDIREYYKPAGSSDMRPGKKGVCLTPAQWAHLKSHMDDIDKKLTGPR